MLITITSKQFGTNFRTTAAISIPNMIRGALTLTLILFKWLRSISNNYIEGAWITRGILIIIAVVALVGIKESSERDLDFLEH